MHESLIVLVRGIIGFFTLLIFARLLGKQQVSQLTFFDYVLGITIGSTASSLTTDLTSTAWAHWVGLFTWTATCYCIQWISLKSKKASVYLDDKPTIVMANGQILEEAMKNKRYRLSDLLEQLREKGVFDLEEVDFAILEKDGQLSVLKKAEYQPVTPKDMKLPTNDGSGMSIQLIYDGIIIEENLKSIKKDKQWLKNELKKNGVKSPSEVFAVSINTGGQLYIDRYKDNRKPN
ncbi:DUF421 domain-containing protein [Clostridium sp. A1-XYC3]|uniref:DUF421 domain-containing protein n=1 Tax=Clostridium tanneri TaxID=3037988 RepID=A0ABU4JQX6_9CLOT|nr:DUF421 domain-containing protein [Clostridium sp. A1-XYC3]MDW8800384.1 DUF421 domain-containing protein [Clostridium sp. A1-XYC3]